MDKGESQSGMGVAIESRVVRVGSTEKPPLKEASRKNVPGRGTSECEALRFQASWHIQAAG